MGIAQRLEGLAGDDRGRASTFFWISEFFAASGSSATRSDRPQPATMVMANPTAKPRRAGARDGT